MADNMNAYELNTLKARLRSTNSLGGKSPVEGQMVGRPVGGVNDFVYDFEPRQTPMRPYASELGVEVPVRAPPGYQPPPSAGPSAARVAMNDIRASQLPGSAKLDALYDLGGGNLNALPDARAAQFDARLGQMFDAGTERAAMRQPIPSNRALTVPEYVPNFRTQGGPYTPQTDISDAYKVVDDAPRLLRGPDRVAAGMGNYMRGQNSASYAERMGEMMRGARQTLESGALDAAGAGSAVGPVLRSAAPYARTAAGFLAGPAALGALAAGGWDIGEQAMDPNSPIRRASRGAKADMAKDWAEGNYARAAGDAVRAMGSTGLEVVKSFLAPSPITNAINGAFGVEREADRNYRLAQEAAAQRQAARDDLATRGLMILDVAGRPTGGAAPAPAARSQAIPLDVMEHAYHVMAPKTRSVTDLIRAQAAKEINDRFVADMANAKTDKERRALQDARLNDWVKLANPSSIAFGGLNNQD